MVSYKDLQVLKAYAPQGNGYVLSLYLDVDQSKASNLNRGFETVLNNILRAIEGEIDGEAGQEFEASRARVIRFIRSYTPRGKSLAVFCDAVRDFWWQRELPVYLPNVGRFAHSPFLQPLIETLDEYERYGVVLIDKERARLFTVYLGEIEEHAGVFSELPRKTVTTSTDRIWSQKSIQRHHDEHVHWHAKNVADKLRDLAYQYKFDRLIVGGGAEAASELLRVLPKPLSDRVVGTISPPIGSPLSEVLAEVRKIEEQAEREDELKLMESLVTAVNKGDRATLGSADTVQAINEGRVWRVLYVKNYTLSGHVCGSCGALFLEPRTQGCLYCETPLESVANVVDLALERVLALGGLVEEIRGPAAEMLARSGSLGAFLRY